MASPALAHQRPVVDRDLQHEIEQFLYAEADLLDERRFDEWLSLFADDLRYLMPNRPSQVERDRRGYSWGKEGFAFFDDTLASMRMRVRRLQTGAAWAEEPPSRTRRLLSCIRLLSLPGDEVECRVNFCVYRSRRERDEDFFVGSRRDRLARADNGYGWLIHEREIRLDQTVLTHHNLSIFF
jgi:3-phenylpropionate/trans-cinnamate dioxygenase subunit beta